MLALAILLRWPDAARGWKNGRLTAHLRRGKLDKRDGRYVASRLSLLRSQADVRWVLQWVSREAGRV